MPPRLNQLDLHIVATTRPTWTESAEPHRSPITFCYMTGGGSYTRTRPNPAACDRMGPDGRLIEGNGGVDAGTMSTLAIVPCVLSDADWLTPDHHVRLLAAASVTTGIARLLADDPGTAILHSLVARMCATLDHATRTN